jgi:hypothetical protein
MVWKVALPVLPVALCFFLLNPFLEGFMQLTVSIENNKNVNKLLSIKQQIPCGRLGQRPLRRQDMAKKVNNQTTLSVWL